MTRATLCRTRQYPRAADGFTLIELMLAAAIAAMLSLAIYASLSTAFKARATANMQTSAMRRAAIALDLLEADLQSVTAADGTLNGPFIGYALGSTGSEADSVSFCCLNRDATTPTGGLATNVIDDPLAEGARKVTLSLRTDGLPTPSLVRSVQRNLLATTVTTQDEVLADDIKALSIRYYDGSEWTEEWDSTLRADNSVPIAVQITIELRERGPRASSTDPQQGYRATRIFPLACSKIVASTSGLGGM